MAKDKTLFRVNQIIHYITYAITALLTLRFLLKFLGANPAAAFTEIIYSLSYILVAPLHYVFSPLEIGGGILEWNTLLAIIVYWIIGEGILMAVSRLRSIDQREAQNSLREND